ncbi:MAG TPA: PmoA family protein [Rugosimonospora sp.]|nr:PmoA family protein [Rugosimonospora sp.]
MNVVHEYGYALGVRAGGTEILRYVYGEDAPQVEAPKPYFHPIRTLSGAVVSGYRPHDHRWHKGLQMTVSHLSGQNFWGGPSYVDGQGYVQLDNVGSVRHEGFDRLDPAPDRLTVVEALTWLTGRGEAWVGERRTIEVHGADPDRGRWILDFGTRLTNIRGTELRLGSPTTHGRPMAGYTGLFWRGPRAFTGGTVHTADRAGTDAMGAESPWLAYTGRHDERDGGATLLVIDASDPRVAKHHWFVRNDPFPAVNPSPAFFAEITIPPAGSIELAYRIVVGDDLWDRARIEATAAELAR